MGDSSRPPIFFSFSTRSWTPIPTFPQSQCSRSSNTDWWHYLQENNANSVMQNPTQSHSNHIPANVCLEAESELASKGSRGCVERSLCQLPAPCVPASEEDKVSPEMLVGSELVAELGAEPSVPTVMLVSTADTSECSITSPAVGMLLGSWLLWEAEKREKK